MWQQCRRFDLSERSFTGFHDNRQLLDDPVCNRQVLEIRSTRLFEFSEESMIEMN